MNVKVLIGCSANAANRLFISSSRSHQCRSLFQLHNKFEYIKEEKLELRTPISISIRHGRTVNLRRANIPNKEKAHILSLTHEQYAYPLEGLTEQETCMSVLKTEAAKKEKQIHPVFPIMAREYMKEVNAAPVLLVMHKMQCSEADLFAMRVQFKRNNMQYLKFYTDSTMYDLAFKDTKYSSLLPLFKDNVYTVTAVSYDRDINKILKLERRLQYLSILCCVMDGQILHKADMQKVAALPPLDLMRASLCQTLSSHQSLLSGHLAHHQMELSSALERYVSPLDDAPNKTDAPEES